MENSQYIVVICNCPDLVLAESIARELVISKLAVCINILPGVKSIYTWQEKLESCTEYTLIIKSTLELFTSISDKIKELHVYTCPEIIALPIQCGSAEYLAWLDSNLISP